MPEDEVNPDELRRVIEGPDELARADALLDLGTYLSGEGDFVEAEGCFGSAADLFNTLERPFPRMLALRLLADNQFGQNRYAEAIENYRKALVHATELGDARNKAYASGALGDALRCLNRIDEAFEAHKDAAAAFAEIDEPNMVGTNLISVGEILYRRNQTKAAAEQYSLAYNQFQMAGNAYRGAFAKDYLSVALAAQGEYEEAISHIQDTVAILHHLDEPAAQRAAEYSKGLLLLEAGRYVEAAELLFELTLHFRDEKQFIEAANCELAHDVARFRNNFDESWPILKRSLPRLRAYFDAAGLGANVLKADRFLAEWYAMQEAWPKTVRLLRAVVIRSRELDELNLERSSRARLASALIELGEYQEAQQVLEEVDESSWGDVKPEIEYLRKVRETLEIRLAPEAD